MRHQSRAFMVATIDVDSCAEFLDELEHPVVKGLGRVFDLRVLPSSSPSRSRQVSCLASARSIPRKTEIAVGRALSRIHLFCGKDATRETPKHHMR